MGVSSILSIHTQNIGIYTNVSPRDSRKTDDMTSNVSPRDNRKTDDMTLTLRFVEILADINVMLMYEQWRTKGELFSGRPLNPT